ncbi:MAG TPA: hypothetical protein VFC19_28270 [Candidatus Limnocylindrales bacterium]|nr:hypothetical protein [Candidatus Limnocylindrales bacterium]
MILRGAPGGVIDELPYAVTCDDLGVVKTQTELIDGLRHVGYEVTMTAESAARLGRHVTDEFVRNALLESMLLHIRSLTDFFVYTNPRPRPTDMLRIHFAPEWTAPKPEATRVLAGRNALHKHLAHLTWERVDQGKQGYPLAAAQDIIRIADAWSRHLGAHDAALHAEFRPFALNARAVIAPRSPYVVTQTTMQTVITTTS